MRRDCIGLRLPERRASESTVATPDSFLKQQKSLTVLLVVLFITSLAFAQSNEDCAMCHDDPSLTTTRNGRQISRYIPGNILEKSVHSYLECVSCHTDAAVEDFPHPDTCPPVTGGECHDEAMTNFLDGIHGQAFIRKDKNAPSCSECHGTHQIIPSTDPQSPTYKMNIPVLCGKCHREGAPVARAYNISERNILENYSQGIHGRGLFNAGLIVTATCNDCHGNHLVLPHTNSRSSISQKNIASTCMKCHARIEDVHTKIINRELWVKFDYFAVFWGVMVIGSTGLMLWFPETFTKILPGWLINVAQIIHSDEALLAVGFIFTIHFFNTHLRPESFPMDTVIFYRCCFNRVDHILPDFPLKTVT
ncbi:MAG: hypothetical protein ACK5HT_14405 [Draconibacterium sp.]